MDMEEKGTQVCDQTGDTAPDAGEQEDFEALIRGRYKEASDARELQRLYPDFCWQEEMRREDFGRLILAGVEPRTAYETVHGRELMEKAMRYAAGRTRRQVAGSLASGMGRVAENGGRSIAVTASDPRGLTSEDLADIRRRVLDGEKIRF